ncbi:MAG TPA: SDR family NAD(P)-dependent oxidoreductase [Ignavibacteriaceae bacterium]|nr:SDR family NAD(P)-dependent oxidoreductase [Ignavibacteriaceae bacterium]
MKKLSDKIVFITGASSGIGKACAEVFASEGANLIITARRISILKKLAESLTKKYKVKVLPKQLDVSKKAEVKKLVSSLSNEWNKIDILINNAGLARGLSDIEEGNYADWEEMIDTNVKGLLYVSREILPLMVKRKKGHVINIGSIAGHTVYPKGNVYNASKFAVKALSKAMRLDLYQKDIRISSVDPGMVETEFSLVRFRGDKERAKKTYEGVNALSSEDIADAVLYCATRPQHVNIDEIIIMPTVQASPMHIKRNE